MLSLVKDQGPLVEAQFGHLFPGGYLPEIAAGRSAQVAGSLDITAESADEQLFRRGLATVPNGAAATRNPNGPMFVRTHLKNSVLRR